MSDPRLPSSPTVEAPDASTVGDRVQVRHDLSFSEAKQEAIREFEELFLRRLIAQARGNISRAARHAKMDRMYLHRLLGRHPEVGFERRSVAARDEARTDLDGTALPEAQERTA